MRTGEEDWALCKFCFLYAGYCIAVFSVCPCSPLCNLWFFYCKEGGIYRDETDSFEVEKDGYVDKKLQWRNGQCQAVWGDDAGGAVAGISRKQACPVPTASAIFFFALLLSLICQNGPSVLLFA